MTYLTNQLTPTRLPADNIIGPYSVWPRRPKSNYKRPAILASTAVFAGVFVHCVVPMIA